MGLLTYLADAWKAVRRPPNEGEQRYIGASIRTGEEIAGRYDTTNPRDMACVSRAVSGSIFNAAALIARAAARGEIGLYRSTDGQARKAYTTDSDDVEQITDHPALDLLRDPDPAMSSTDVLQLVYWYREVCGHCYLWTGSGTPSGLYILHPQWTRPVLDKAEGVVGYNYGRENIRPLYVPTSEVVVSKWMIDPFAPWQGVSWVRSIERYGDLEDAAVAAEVARWKNSGQYGMVLKAPTGYTDAQIKQAESALRARGGPLAAGRAMVLRDVELIQSAAKPHEMNYLPGLQQAEAAIYRAAGVPDPIWKMNDAIQSNAAEGGAQWQRAIYERQCRVADDLTEWLLPMFGVEPGEMWFAYPNQVGKDVAAESARVAVAFQAGACYLNEYRKVLGLEPVDDALNTMGSPIARLGAPGASATATPDPKAKPAPNTSETPNSSPDAAAQEALNGAQVTSIVTLATQVSTGAIPIETAYAIAQAAFPAITTETLDRVFNPLRNFTPETPSGTNQQGTETQTGGGEDNGGRGKGGSSDAGGDGEPEDAGDGPSAKGGRKPAGLGRKAGTVELIRVPRWGAFGACGCDRARKSESGPTDPIETRIFRAVQEWANDALTRGIAGIGPDGSFDISKLASAELEKLMRASITAAFNAGAASFIEEAGLDAEPLTSEAAREYVKGYTFELVKGVTETMADQMRTVIDDGLAKGQTINEIQQQLTDRVPDVSLARAETIARTENARAQEYGKLTQAEELGFEGKTWSLSGNPCGLCEGASAALSGTVTPIGEPFFPAGTAIVGTDGKVYTMSRDVRAATDIHPNCSCASIMVQERTQ